MHGLGCVACDERRMWGRGSSGTKLQPSLNNRRSTLKEVNSPETHAKSKIPRRTEDSLVWSARGNLGVRSKLVEKDIHPSENFQSIVLPGRSSPTGVPHSGKLAPRIVATGRPDAPQALAGYKEMWGSSNFSSLLRSFVPGAEFAAGSWGANWGLTPACLCSLSYVSLCGASFRAWLLR